MLRSWIIALGVLVIASLWMLSGYFETSASDARAVSTPQSERPLPRVRAEVFQAGDNTRQLMIQGRTEADRMVVISSQTDGQLANLLVQRGDTVVTGDLIAQINVENRQDRVTEARAILARRQLEFNAANSLSERGFQSEVRLAEAKAELETAKSDFEQAKIELDYTEITAPIDGIVLQRMVEAGSFVDRGEEVIRIVDLDPIKIVGSVPESEVSLINLSQTARIEAISPEPIQGTVTFIAPQADAATRTFEIEIAVPNPDNMIRAGLTAAIYLPITGAPTHLLPASILTLNETGQLGVKTLNQDNRVEFQRITLVDDAPAGIYALGLPATVRIITIGQEFVIDGQIVDPVFNDDNDSPAQVSER